MSELIDRIPGQASALAKLRGVVNTTLQLNARQRLSGRSGQLGYSIDSENEWDYLAPVSYNNSGYDLGLFKMVFTGDGTQRYPIVLPRFDIRINGAGASNLMTFNPDSGYYEYQDSVVEVLAVQHGVVDSSYFESETQLAWVLRLAFLGKVGSGSFALRIKARAQASCRGAFSVVRSP